MPTVRVPAHGWKPRPYQRPLWDYLEKGGTNAAAVWHRRSGKDEITLHWACVAAHLRRGNYWHMLPEYTQARKAIWDAVNPNTGRLRIDDAFPHELRAGTNNTEMKITLRCGSIWQLVGSDNFNSLIGSPPVGIVYSEWAVADPRAHGFLRPILAENGGWSVFIYTPRGYNHGYSTYEEARTGPKNFGQLLTARDTGVFSAEKLEEERAAYKATHGEYDGDALFRQEYLCDWSAANVGAILGRYVEALERAGRIRQVPYDPAGHPIVLSLDIGRRDTTAIWFWQPVPDGFKVIDYDQGSGLDAQEWIERIKKRITDNAYRYDKIWLPHDARVRKFEAQHSAAEQFAQAGLRVDIVPMTAKAQQIDAARVVIPNCWFDRERCAPGLSGLREWSFEWDGETRTFSREPRHDWASHPGDAFAYGAQVMRAQTITPEKPKPGLPKPPLTIDEYIAMADKPSRQHRRI